MTGLLVPFYLRPQLGLLPNPLQTQVKVVLHVYEGLLTPTIYMSQVLCL